MNYNHYTFHHALGLRTMIEIHDDTQNQIVLFHPTYDIEMHFEAYFLPETHYIPIEIKHIFTIIVF